MSAESQPVLTMITLDRESSSMSFMRSDAKEARFPLPAGVFGDSSALSRIHVAADYAALLAVTRAGDDVAFELPVRNHDRRHGRLAVYLDQNMWSLVSRALHDASAVTASEANAVNLLVEWVRERRILLPASSGHYYETTKRFDPTKRYQLGLTILQLSRGWQMLDALQVRRNELRSLFLRRQGAAAPGVSVPVFTLAPNALHAARGMEPLPAPPDFDEDEAFQHAAVVAASTYIDTMLDAERLEASPQDGWVVTQQAFSNWLDGEARDSRQKRKLIDLFFLADLRMELAAEAHASGIALGEFEQWFLGQLAHDIGGLPSLGLYRAVLTGKHLKRGLVWKSNDLIDMMYLSCAAGYADMVVCEKHMRDQLEHGLRRAGLSTPVFRRLTDAVEGIGRLLESS